MISPTSVWRRKTGLWQSKNEKNQLKVRTDPGKTGASRRNLLLTVALTKLLFYTKPCYTLSWPHNAYDCFSNNFRMNIRWNHTVESELLCPGVSSTVSLERMTEVSAVFLQEAKRRIKEANRSHASTHQHPHWQKTQTKSNMTKPASKQKKQILPHVRDSTLLPRGFSLK